ncbi:MAG: hypothetical protein JG775_2535 [Defluviitaleaceae bacterium]|jgi:hypothetical protein|nr:hypothetical protein [Defluviitaleaceae bacterium]
MLFENRSNSSKNWKVIRIEEVFRENRDERSTVNE